VVTPLPGGPAERAGIRAGDAIISIDSTPTAGLSLYEASDLLLGEIGSEVQMSLQHADQAESFTVALTRLVQRLARV
jgi:carboxyl-terminal processing protease